MDPKVGNDVLNQIINPSSGNECFILNITTWNGIWQSDNPFHESFPLLVSQLAAILIFTRSLYHLLKPFRQPRIISDILGGILLGPSAFGKTTYFADLFPQRNVITVQTLAYLALNFHMFLVGLEFDLSAFRRISRKALSFTLAALFFPFALGIFLFYLIHSFLGSDNAILHQVNIKGGLLWATALTITSFPIVREILSDLKLLNSDIGHLAMPIALLCDIGSWLLIIVIIPFCTNPVNGLYIVIATVAYILACIHTFRPLLAWTIRCTSNGEDDSGGYSDFYLCFVLVGVLLSAFVTDVIGTHSIVGAFVFGIIMPGELAVVLIERFDCFVSGLMMPIFFAVSGVRVNIFGTAQWSLGLLILPVICAVKIVSFLPISVVSDNIKTRDRVAIGLLMNAKGVWAILIIQTGVDRGVLVEDDYAVMMVTFLLITSFVASMVAAICKQNNLSVQYEQRTIQHSETEAELRILSCIHSFGNVPGILKLLDVSNDTQSSYITAFTLHLVELTGRGSAMLIVHDSQTYRFDHAGHGYHPDYNDSSEMEQIVDAFREYESRTRNISIQSFTSVSPLVAMHGDICSLAEDKKVAILILPFHGGEAFSHLNKNVLRNAPCSVGIYIDRGALEGVDSNDGVHQIAMVFIGGRDDCEALAYAWRMAKHPEVNLMVIRLLEMDTINLHNREREIDDEYINEFRGRTVGEQQIEYVENIFHDGEELVMTLIEIEKRFELLIIGRREGLESPLRTKSFNKVEYHELGAVGDFLTRSDSATASILVVQQFVDCGYRQDFEDFDGARSSTESCSPGLGAYRQKKLMDGEDDDYYD